MNVTYRYPLRDATKIEIVNFGVVDSKNRQIGAQISTAIVEVREAREDESYLSRETTLGPKFWLRFHATRDGSLYGAMQGSQLFDTEAERTAEIERYLASAKKRAAKKAK